jgi:hypothetical protein
LQLQERQATTRADKLIDHTNEDIFILNMYALHNAALLQKVLPEDLIKPKSKYKDRRAHHNILATALQVTQMEKRAKTQEKRKATLAAKKAQKRKQEEAIVDDEESREENSGEVVAVFTSL